MAVEPFFGVASWAMGIFQTVALIAISPLIVGVMRKVKAGSQKRIGSSIFQPYYDLRKLMMKEEVISDQSSWIFRVTPWIVFVATATAALFIPVFISFTPFAMAGDLLLVIGLLGLARFFTLLAGLDVASAFGGLGSSREMMMSSIIEPAIFITIFAISLTYGGTNVSTIVTSASNAALSSPGQIIAPSLIFAVISFFIIIMAETGRIPFDNPATHLELTMVHEAMVLEYSGRSLALMEWAQSIKMAILLVLLVNIFAPWGIVSAAQLNQPGAAIVISPLILIGKMMLVAILVAHIETRVAKWRLFRLPDLLAMAISSSLIGVVFFYL
jgi:formate hydrogenlyase subunit 4